MSAPHDPNSPWGQPSQYGQPQYGPPQQPQYGQPQYGQPQYGQPYGNQPYGGQPQYQYGQPQGPFNPAPPPAKRNRGKLIAASAAVVVLAGGGVATYVAVSSSNGGGGAASPKAAVQTLVSDINNDDLIGVLDDLPPGERDAISKPFTDSINELKRDGAIRSDANFTKVDGVDVQFKDLQFSNDTQTINDHVQVVELTGGTVHVSADASKLPFTSDFLDALGDNAPTSNDKIDRTVDIGAEVNKSGKPVRIAAQKVGDTWYPSLFYSIADNAAKDANVAAPSAADAIPAQGAQSADAAVRSFVQSLLNGRVGDAIKLTSPDELAVLHDYGKIIVDRTHYDSAPVQIKNLKFQDKSISGGTRVLLRKLEFTSDDGTAASLTIDGDCVTLGQDGRSQKYCASQAADQISQAMDEPLTSAERSALAHLFQGLGEIGIDTTQSGGSWYVNPVRSYFDLTGALLSKLQGNDLITLIKLVGRQ